MRIQSRSGSFIVTFLACLSAALVLSSCKKTPQEQILGKWNVEGEPTTVEYRKDGTIVTVQAGHETMSKYRFVDDSHMELEASARAGTNVITLRMNCEIAVHGDTAEVTATLPGNAPGAPPVSKTQHYTRAK